MRLTYVTENPPNPKVTVWQEQASICLHANMMKPTKVKGCNHTSASWILLPLTKTGDND